MFRYHTGLGSVGREIKLPSAEGGKRRDEPGKENLELKNCIALVVI